MSAEIKTSLPNTLFTWGTLEAEFRNTDYTHVERFEQAMEAFQVECDKSREMEKASEKIKCLVLAVAGVFDTLFGEDAANKVLGPSTDLNEAFDAFYAFVAFYREQDAEAADRFNSIAQRYAPNRAARRTKPIK